MKYNYRVNKSVKVVGN